MVNILEGINFVCVYWQIDIVLIPRISNLPSQTGKCSKKTDLSCVVSIQNGRSLRPNHLISLHRSKSSKSLRTQSSPLQSSNHQSRKKSITDDSVEDVAEGTQEVLGLEEKGIDASPEKQWPRDSELIVFRRVLTGQSQLEEVYRIAVTSSRGCELKLNQLLLPNRNAAIFLSRLQVLQCTRKHLTDFWQVLVLQLSRATPGMHNA